MTKPNRPFLFLDGEGGNREDGSHEYIVLCGWSEYTGELILRNDDGSPLATRQILEWLLDLSARLKREQHPHTFVGFGLGYDVAMWLKDIPWHPAHAFYSPARAGWIDPKGMPRYVPWSAYSMRVIGSEYSFIDSIWGLGARTTKENRRSIAVWDVWKFFQGSFVKALENWAILSADELDAIETMKKKRSTFDADEISDEIIAYCLSECRSGVALMAKLDATCTDLGYQLRRYDGAGSLAAAMLRAWSIDMYQAPVPEDMTDAVSCAYFGGRFEIAAHGRTMKPVYQYDINSAYPAIIKDLPCLACSEWHESAELEEEGLYEVEWVVIGRCQWGPLPHRNRRGEITYPQCGRGWYWGSEVLAAQRLYPGCIVVRRGWRLQRNCHHVPFAEVPEVYRQRQRLGSDAAGIVLKLGLNSLYGKTAQSIGSPKYANYIWAGMITAGTRAMILDAIRLAGPEHVLMAATDAVVTDREVALPMREGKPLGDWTCKVIPAGILVIQPGITIAYDSDGVGTYKSRGLGKSEFAKHAPAAERAWAELGVFGDFTAESHRFIGVRTALARRKYETRCRWVDVQSRLRYFPGVKRELPRSELMAHTMNRQAISLAAKGYDYPSTPYPRIKLKLEYDAATEISEQPSIECEWLEVTANG